MATQVALEPTTTPAAKRRDFGSSARLWGGFFGRAWLWFVAGCLVVTFLPMLFGWRPYVVESGSMQPRIKVGDVILSSPEHDAKKLLGHVTVFKDPDPSRAGTVKSHRVIKIKDDGTLVTKGDANLTPDPAAVPMSDVKGIGRLLVRWIGLPLIWVQNGAWLKLGLVVLSFWVAAVLVVRDHDEPEDEMSDVDDGADDDFDPDAGDDLDDLSELDDSADDEFGVTQPARWKPRRSRRLFVPPSRHRRALTKPEVAKIIGSRTAVVTITAGALLLPTTQAAFSATSQNTASNWSAAAVFGPNYTNDVNALGPYLYWKLDDSGDPTTNPTGQATDYSGNNRNGVYSPSTAGFTMQQPGGLYGQGANLAVLSPGGRADNASCVYTNAAKQNPAPTAYSEIIWFNTTSTQGGKLIGFESNQTGVTRNDNGGQYDRHLYMSGDGTIYFGVWTGATTTISSGPGYNDGLWHMAVATMGTGGMNLYLDGQLVGSSTNKTSQDYSALGGGWWRVGCGDLQGWGGSGAWSGGNAPGTTQTNYAFTGYLDEATVYTKTLAAQDVAQLYYDINPPTPPAITNPGFENSPLGWTTASGACSQSTAQNHAGSDSMSVVAAKNKTAECDQSLTFAPYASYTLVAWVYGNNVTVGVKGGATASTTVSPGSAWQQVSVPFAVGANGSITLYVSTPGGAKGNTVYVDDFSITSP